LFDCDVFYCWCKFIIWSRVVISSFSFRLKLYPICPIRFPSNKLSIVCPIRELTNVIRCLETGTVNKNCIFRFGLFKNDNGNKIQNYRLWNTKSTYTILAFYWQTDNSILMIYVITEEWKLEKINLGSSASFVLNVF
jgi:hypothetical protein